MPLWVIINHELCRIVISRIDVKDVRESVSEDDTYQNIDHPDDDKGLAVFVVCSCKG